MYPTHMYVNSVAFLLNSILKCMFEMPLLNYSSLCYACLKEYHSIYTLTCIVTRPWSVRSNLRLEPVVVVSAQYNLKQIYSRPSFTPEFVVLSTHLKIQHTYCFYMAKYLQDSCNTFIYFLLFLYLYIISRHHSCFWDSLIKYVIKTLIKLHISYCSRTFLA